MEYDATEMRNPRRTLARREIEAGLEQGIPESHQRPAMSQADFFKKGPTMDPKKKQKRLAEMLRARGG